MLDDSARKNGKDRNCGSQCTRHKVLVTSDVDQYVWVGAHTYRYYSYGDGEDCPTVTNDPLLAKLGKTDKNADKRKNMFFNNKLKSATSWEAGDMWFPKMFMKRGETAEFEVELNWNRPGITKDWSVTAWGESGSVQVTHSDGIPSEHLPFTPKEGARSDQKYYSKPDTYEKP